MNNKLSYDINFIDTLSTLAHISPQSNQQVLIAKTDDKLFVTSNTSDKGVYYTVKADKEAFDFDGSKFCRLWGRAELDTTEVT